MNCWWTSEPVAYTDSNFEGHRIRLLIAEKRARVVTRINGLDEFPSSLDEVNPEGIFPILVDKNLICHGAALDELIHERFPSPTLLPIDPVKRAQVRMLAYQVRGWYGLPKQELLEKLREVDEVYDGSTLYITGNFVSIVDIALAPLIYDTPDFVPSDTFRSYIERIQARPAFAQSLRSSTPIAPEEDLNDEAAA